MSAGSKTEELENRIVALERQVSLMETNLSLMGSVIEELTKRLTAASHDLGQTDFVMNGDDGEVADDTSLLKEVFLERKKADG